MPELDEERRLGKALLQLAQKPLVLPGPAERVRKLREEAAQLPSPQERLDGALERSVELVIEASFVGHVVVRLHDELESRRCLPLHRLERARRRDAVIGRVHLDGREMADVVVEHLPALGARRIERSDPVREGVARGTDQDHGGAIRWAWVIRWRPL